MEEAQMSSEDSGSRPVEDQTKTDSKSSEEASSTASPKSTQLHKPIQVALAEVSSTMRMLSHSQRIVDTLTL